MLEKNRMKIFFTASIAGREVFGESYIAIVDKLRQLGHQVQADHILGVNRREIREEHTDERRVEWYKRVLKMISDSDVVIAEISYPSMNVGHEISIALEKEKPVIVFYKRGHHQVLLEGIRSEKFIRVEYDSIENEVEDLSDHLKYAQDQSESRFNFFISPKHQNYLDWISKHKKLPRAVYLRSLIEKDMKASKDVSEDK